MLSYLMIGTPFGVIIGLWVLTFIYVNGAWFYVACVILALISLCALFFLWLLANLHIQ